MVDGVGQRGAVPQGIDVSQHGANGRDFLQRIEGVAAVGAVYEQRVGVDVLNGAGEGDAPEALAGQSPPLEDGDFTDMNTGGAAVVYIHLAVVVDGDVTCIG